VAIFVVLERIGLKNLLRLLRLYCTNSVKYGQCRERPSGAAYVLKSCSLLLKSVLRQGSDLFTTREQSRRGKGSVVSGGPYNPSAVVVLPKFARHVTTRFCYALLDVMSTMEQRWRPRVK
jgi:hypothetical protein